jgi:predicted dehydrogenase
MRAIRRNKVSLIIRRGRVVTAALFAMTLSAAHPAAAQQGVRFMTLDPGHFHAALVHKEMYPEVSPQIDIYAPKGWDLDEHLKRIEGFNARAQSPTAWKVNVHTGPDFFRRMIAERPGNAVVLAGRNRKKIDYVLGALQNRLHVLADKPWIIRSADLPRLQRALETAERRGLVAYDVMTERHEITTQLQRELVNDPAVFGGLVFGSPEKPAVYMKSVHHIMKEVAGAPLRRPAWFFDIREQGEALADIGTHLVDLSLWTLFPEEPIDHRRDVRVHSARRWPTPLTREQFGLVTGEPDFPAGLRPWVKDGKLDFFANTAVNYSVRGVNVGLDILWDLENREHGDTHHAVYRGGKARVEVRQGAAEKWRPETYVVPNDPALEREVLAAVKARVAALQQRWPGVGVEDQGDEIHITVPDRYRVGHEAHFAEVTRLFLDYLRDPASVPEWEKANMLAKYHITTRGSEMSLPGR